MFYESVDDSPYRSQFEASSGSLTFSQIYNCGPASIVKVAQYHKDKLFGIEDTRVLGAQRGRPTTAFEQLAMLEGRGVRGDVISIDSMAQLADIVGTSGNRPITIGVQFIRVPDSYADHDFDGWHAITIMRRVTQPVKGWEYSDSNFSPRGGIRPDPDHGKKFWPDWVMEYAFIRNFPRMCIVSRRGKAVAPDTVIGDPMDKAFRVADGKIRMRANKPMRRGYKTSSETLMTSGRTGSVVHVIGYIPIPDLPGPEKKYGRNWIGRKYRPRSHGLVLVHIKNVDVKEIL